VLTLPLLSHKQKMIDNTKAQSLALSPLSSSEHKQGKIDDALEPLPLPSCAPQLSTLLHEQRAIDGAEVPLFL
jgi:hypothetical protein